MILRIFIGIGALFLGASWAMAEEYTLPASVDYLAPQKRFSSAYRVQQYRMQGAEAGGRDLLLNGARFDTGEAPESQAVLRQYDAAIAYPVMDRWMNLDLGVNFRFYDGQVSGSDAWIRIS